MTEIPSHELLAGMLDAVIAIDDHGIVLDASRACREVFGYTPAELRGQNVSILMPEPHRSRHDEYLAHYRETGETWILNTTRTFECVRRDGRTISCELSVSRADLADGTYLFLGSFRDVTERVHTEAELRASEARFRAVFDQEFQYLGMLSPDGILLEVNRTALAFAATTREEVLGEPFWNTPWWDYCDEARERLRQAIVTAADGGFARFEAELMVGGALRYVDFSVKPVVSEEGRVQWLVAEGRDLTELKQAQERETSMLRAFASVGESAAVLAHEIKNPITAVNAALRAVARHLGEDDQTVLTDLSGRMQKLERLIQRTLSFAKPLNLLPRPVRVGDCIGELRALLADEFQERNCALELEVDPDCPSVAADDSLLEEVLHNLVRNALQAGAGTVRVSARPYGEGIRISVDDDGPGITPSVLPRIFDPFVTTKANGTGIGLALSKKIVNQHGGRLRIGESELGGARFDVDLPKSID